MAVLKRGSKGRGVEEAQMLLNKAGAKPKLTVDGIFGPLTDKQTREFQKKKGKTKVDGKIGEKTLATLKFGGPLPVLPEIATDSFLTSDAHSGDYNAVMAKSVVEAEKKFSAMVAIATKKFSITRKMQAKNVEEGKHRVATAKKIIALKQTFEKNLKSDPKKAEKLVAEIEKLGDEWYRLQIGETDYKWRDQFDVIPREMSKCLKVIENI